MNSLSEHTNMLVADMAKQALEDHLAWLRSPVYQRALEESRARWMAKPWHERARIRTKAWVRDKRIRLGEIIAGADFE